MAFTPYQEIKLRYGAMENERSSWITRYREISEFMLPYSGRFFVQDRNRGNKSFNSIYNSTATQALGVLASGMMSGMTSPARPWFRLTTPDAQMAERAAVKLWLDDVSQLLRDIFERSNTYRSLHMLYKELGAFGTASNIVDFNFDTVIHHTPLTAGEYCIATGEDGSVNTLARFFEMTVAQMVEKFGIENCSDDVQNLWTTKSAFDTWIPVLHVIQPRKERDLRAKDAKNKRVASNYIEWGGVEGQYLRESGYDEFPALSPRWDVQGGDIYGNGPGFVALGDTKGLQHLELRGAQAVDYQVKPPLMYPTALKNQEKDALPGGVTYYDPSSPNAKIQSLFDVSLNMQHLDMRTQRAEMRINEAMYVNLFRMLANQQSVQPITAREVAERQEEKLILLGPVLERLHNELLSPLIDITFAEIVRNRLLPPPPPEMQGQDLKIEFVSTLAQAQRMVGLASMDRIIGTVASIAAAKQDPSVFDKLNTDEVIDRYADLLGVDPSIIVADDQVAIIREQRAQQLKMQQAAAMAASAADSAAKLGTVDMSTNNAASNVIQSLQGFNGAPQ